MALGVDDKSHSKRFVYQIADAPDPTLPLIFPLLHTCNPGIYPFMSPLPTNHGEVAEWSNAAVLKTVEVSKVPGVRIPPSPPFLSLQRTQDTSLPKRSCSAAMGGSRTLRV